MHGSSECILNDDIWVHSAYRQRQLNLTICRWKTRLSTLCLPKENSSLHQVHSVWHSDNKGLVLSFYITTRRILMMLKKIVSRTLLATVATAIPPPPHILHRPRLKVCIWGKKKFPWCSRTRKHNPCSGTDVCNRELSPCNALFSIYIWQETQIWNE